MDPLAWLLEIWPISTVRGPSRIWVIFRTEKEILLLLSLKFHISLIFDLYADLRKIQDLGDFRDEAQSSPERNPAIDVEIWNPVTTVLVDPLAWLMALDERNSISKFDPFPWFSACTRTCEKFRIWVIFGMKLKVVLRVDWCRNPVTAVLVDPLAWLWTKEIQFRNLTHFLDFRPVRGPTKIQDLGDFRDEAQSSPQSRLMSKSCYYCPSGPTSMALDERNSISKFEPFPWFSPVRGPAKNSGFGWFSGWSSK